MPRRNRERMEFLLWIVLSVGSAFAVSNAHNELSSAVNTLKGCPYVAQR